MIKKVKLKDGSIPIVASIDTHFSLAFLTIDDECGQVCIGIDEARKLYELLKEIFDDHR